MPLARLENLLKNLNGNILYVDPGQLDSTDSIENRGNSALRPFKTIQRALLEAVRFSYVQGANNDLFDQTTILISSGTHYIDNRPGYYVDGNTVKTYGGSVTSIPELNLQSILDITDSANELYKYNSADGGVIIPKGVSIVASDLRKTKVRPKYVPSPTDSLIDRSSIFRLTGACYIYGFSIFDGDPNGNVYSSPTSTFQTPPSYSHHKLTAFEYVDGKNKYVKNGVTLDKTDLEMYYYKVSKGFGPNSGIPVIIDWGVNASPDLYPNIEENRIVGDLGLGAISIDSLYAGDGINDASNIVTVTTTSNHNLSPNTSILISNIGQNVQERSEYNGAFTVAQVVNSTQFTYRLSDEPESTLAPTVNNDSIITTVSDTVSSSSPYVFNCSLKSVYGMNGLHADGSKATGFKSIVTAQFTGISLQKDDNAFVVYNEDSGTYNDQSSYPDEFLHQNSRSVYKPSWESYHIKASNDAFIQCVSIFAIGYSKHFIADDGGDQSITNSNSNFGAIALSARGFKDYQLEKDNHGFITHIIPPKEILSDESIIRCLSIDSEKTADLASSNSNTRIYLEDYDNSLDVPPTSFKGFTIGGRENDKIYINSSGVSIGATVSPNYKIDVEISSIDIATNTITISESLSVGAITGINTSQAVRIISNNGVLPDGIEPQKIYYVNSSELTSTQLKLSENESNSSVVDIKTDIGVTSGNLRLVSKVSDRLAGQPACPIQFDEQNSKWYISIQSDPSFVTAVSAANNPVVYINRVVDTRSLDDKLYRARLVIPKDSVNASEPSTGFILQRSSSALSDNYTLPNPLESISESRNTNQIVDAWITVGSSNIANIITKTPHNLKSGNIVNIYNLKSSNEPAPVGLGTGTGFNGSFVVQSVINDLHFTYKIAINPGTITTTGTTYNTWLSSRNCSSTSYRVPPYTIDDDTAVRGNLPYFTCESINAEYQLYKINTIQKYSYGVSDGVYYVTLNAFKNTPTVSPFNTDNLKLSQSIENLYPQSDLDNINSDPLPTKTVASRKIIGTVNINDPENSVTKETVSEFLKDFGVGAQISSISKSGSTCTVTTTRNHGLGGVQSLSISGGSAGTGFVNGTWYDIPLCGGDGVNATANVSVSGGAVTSATISYHGSGYAQGNTLTLRGIPHSSTNGSSITVTVASVFSGTKSIQIIGTNNFGNDGFFPITSFTENTISYSNSNGSAESSSGVAIFSGEGLVVASSTYDSETQKTLITTSIPHSISVGNKVYFSSIASNTFNVVGVASSVTFVVDGDASQAANYNVFPISLSPSLKNSDLVNENLSSRQYPLIGEISVRTSDNSTGDISSTSTSIVVTNSQGFEKSDFIQIDDEIMMITNINGTGISVLRGLFNTKSVAHSRNRLVKKINPIPVELRRNSILRASGHTFEYTGFGPGNYSTGMPTNQNRVLTRDEVLISQSLPTRGGVVLYTGMNSDGEFYIGRKKFNALTGEEELLGIPEAESQSNYSDDLTVNKLTVINELDASTANSTLKDVTVTGTLTGNVSGNVTGNVTGNVSGNAGTVTNGVYTTGNQTIGGTKTFSNTISGSVSGNAGTVTDGVYTTGNQTIGGTKTFSNTISGSVSGNAGSASVASSVSDGVISAAKLTGNQTGSAPIFGVRAWGRVGEDGNLSYGGNVSGANRTGTGDYTVNISTNMLNNNYSVVVTIDQDPGDQGNNNAGRVPYVYSKSISNFKVQIRLSDAAQSGGIEAANAPFNFIIIG